MDYWHQALSRANIPPLAEVYREGAFDVEIERLKYEDNCFTCDMSKMTRKSTPDKALPTNRIYEKGSRWAVDMKDLAETKADVFGNTWMLLFTCMDSRFMVLYPMKSKTNINKKLDDNGGEFISKQFKECCMRENLPISKTYHLVLLGL